MSNEEQSIQIEVEDSDNQNDSVSKANTTSTVPSRINITRKKVSELTEAERNQLIQDAQNNIENPFFNVKMFKNGSTRICLRKQSTAQKVLNEANEIQSTPTPSQSKRYYTDNQLLMEHLINLETSFNELRTKHKKLKKRYNELEGYLYADDEEPQSTQIVKDVQQDSNQPVQADQPVQEQPDQPPVPQQPVHRRYVRSWRDLNSNQ